MMVFNFLGIGEKITEVLQNAFGVNLTDFIINFSATVILFLIVRFVFWNKVTSFLDKKKDKIKEEYKDASAIKDEALEIKREAEETLLSSKSEANDIIVEARREALAQKEEIIAKAKAEAKEIVSESRAQAEREKDEIMKEAKGEIVSIASKIASKMIDENVDSDKYNDEALKALGGNPSE
ncbi:MAG: F0F1 ATP synthase subunit B [Gammaproteobacteria bacterium]|nr:F0F1 ATP synthase subunit B [Gammaproteobacteria bacterium]